ncbi:MAG: FAD-dependent monooxygenase [Myxococcota bacterium]|nr:FAD-dependent monooxygenase [Myxococcota bacterium]
MQAELDVVICGGGLAGLTLARQLRREVPSASVTVVERQRRPLPDAAHKVGESSVELSSHYFGVVLGLGGYLRERHLIKNGLRFFPGGGQTHRIEERTEIGPPDLPKVPSFQLDRGRLENDLRAMCEADGITLMEGFSVREIRFGAHPLEDGGAAHEVVISEGSQGEPRTLRARWVVDAAGRAALIRKKLGLTRPSGHLANASWYRVDGKLDVSDYVPESDRAWHSRDPDRIRWLSTVHFMGTGYWLWLIPLSTGHTSVGVVVHDEVHPFETIHTLEKTKAWIARHEPHIWERIRECEAEDFLSLRHYSHASAKVFSTDRWACVGEAGPFADPFYSPGSDFIALGNSFTTELIRKDLAGEDWHARAEEYDSFYLRFFDVACETYRKAAPCYGQPRVMAAKVYWDDFNYWAFVCQYFFKEIWKLSPGEHARFVEVAKGYATLTFRAQKLLSEWAKRAKDEPRPVHVTLPPIPSLLANLHLDLEKEMSVEETHTYMREKLALAEELLQELLLRAIQALGKDGAVELAREIDLASWGMRIDPARLEAEQAEGGARRRSLSLMARDFERCVGRAERHPDVGSMREIVEHVMGAGAARDPEAAE